MKKSILITGSNKGIGFETARQLGKIGHKIFVSGRDEKRVAEARSQLAGIGIDTDLVVMDVGNAESIKNAASEFVRKKIKLDVLINNAGIGMRSDRVLSGDPDSIFFQVMNVNAYGPLLVTKAFLPLMNDPGRVIMISSGGGSMSDPVGGWWPAYCVSKASLNAITRQLAHELEHRNISVNAVCPGWVRTDMGGQSASLSAEKGAETPVWLATEAEQKLTGYFFENKRKIPW